MPKRGPGYLDLARIDDQLEQAGEAVAREVVVFDGGDRLAPEHIETRVSQLSEDTFGSFEQALGHVTGPPLPAGTDVFWNQGYFDVHLRYPIAGEARDLALEPRLAAALGERLKLILTYLPEQGDARTLEIHGGVERVELDPGWTQVVRSFVDLGFARMPDRLDAILLVACLVLPFGRAWRRSGPILAAFLVVQSTVLVALGTAAALEAAWLAPAVAAAIALVVVWLGLENIVAAWVHDEPADAHRWRWPAALASGGVLGVAFALDGAAELQLAGTHPALAMIAFAAGADAAQLVLAAMVAAPFAILPLGRRARVVVVVLVSALIAHTGWHWLLERVDELRYVDWPVL